MGGNLENERIQRLKKFKDSYILLLCFLLALNLVISKIKTMVGSIGATIGLAAALMSPIFIINAFIKLEERKLRIKNPNIKQAHKKPPHEIFCSECGHTMPKDAKFCEECGVKQ